MCFVWISEQTAIISLYNINWLVCMNERINRKYLGYWWIFLKHDVRSFPEIL